MSLCISQNCISILSGEKELEFWKVEGKTAIPKPEKDGTFPSTYRTITLQTQDWKIFSSILNSFITNNIPTNQYDLRQVGKCQI